MAPFGGQNTGNPFFLEETVHALVETKLLTGERGAYRLAGPIQNLHLPPTVHSILMARIDRLAPEDKRLLQAAAVIGKEVPFALLQTIAEEPEDSVRQGLSRLQAAEFLYETRLFPELEHTFKHALTLEVAYGGLLGGRRRALHAALVEAVERLFPDRLTEHVERLGHHAFRGEVWDKAVVYLCEAGAKSAARSAYRESASCFEQAVAALEQLPQRPEILEQAIDLRFELRNAYGPLGELGRMHESLREAEALATSLGDTRRLAQVSAHFAFYFVWTGQPDRAVEAGQRALTLARERGDLDLDVLASVRLSQAYMALGEYRRALEVLRPHVEVVQGPRIHERFSLPFIASVIISAYMARCFALLGDFSSAQASGEKAVRIAEIAGHQFSLVSALEALGMVHLIRGEIDRALRWLEPALDRCRGGSIPLIFPLVAGGAGWAYVFAGRVAEGLALLRQAEEHASSIRNLSNGLASVLALGDAHLRAGELAGALSWGKRALDLSRVHRQRAVETQALRILGDIRCLLDPPDIETAAALYREALTLAEELGLRPAAAHCHLGLGKLHQRTGTRQQAHEHLTTATTMYRDMGMTHWLEEAAAKLRAVVRGQGRVSEQV